MESPAREPLHEPKHVRKHIRIWVLVGAGLAILTTAILYGGCALFAHFCWSARFCEALWNRPPWTLISGVAAAPALVLLWYWRTVSRGTEIHLKDQEVLSARFADAVPLLEQRGIAAFGGLYSLQRVALDSPNTYAPVVMETLSTFIRHFRAMPERDRGDDDPNRIPTTVQSALLILVRLNQQSSSNLDLRDLDLTGAQLRGLNLDKVLLDRSVLPLCDAGKASLVGASLTEAVVSHASLREANLTSADLRKSCMPVTDLCYAVLVDADIRGADFRAAKLHAADFTRARYDAKTQFPDGFDKAAAGMILCESET